MAVATAAVIGIAASGYQAAQGFKQASDAKAAAKKADAEAAKAMSEAKAKAEVDQYAGLTIPLDAYESEFENQLAVSKQNVEALQEGDARNLAAGVGRIGAQSAEQGEQTRIAMGEDIADLDKMKADSKDAINQQLIEMDVAYAKEQNLRRADAEAARAAGISSGVQGIAGVASGVASLAPLYSQSKADRRGSKLAEQYKDQKPEGMSDAEWAAKLGEKYGDNKEMYKKLKDAEKGRAMWNFKDEEFYFQTDAGMRYDAMP